MLRRSISMGLSTLITWAGVAVALEPPPSLGTIPFDHDRFLQFPESDRADSSASAEAYYDLVDPTGARATLAGWKALNGFVEPLPSNPASLAAMGIQHALYRNATDLGFVRNVYLIVRPNGDVAALLENFASFERTLGRSFDEVGHHCTTPFNPALPPAQQCTSGGIDAFEHRDLSGMLASVVMEYGSVTPGGPKFTRFYGYGNDGQRVATLDLIGRGKQEAFPGLCADCHGGNPGGLDGGGQFVSLDPALPGAAAGNFGGGFLAWDLDLYEYHDPFGAGAAVGSGVYSRANQENAFRELNRIVLQTDPTRALRNLIEGWYGGPGLPGSFDETWVPYGWTFTPEATSLYQNVIGKYCRACHIQRAYPESMTNPNALASRMDFDEEADLEGLRNQIGQTVFARSTMPLALVTYDKLWNDPAAVAELIQYLEVVATGVVPSEDDGFGTLVAQVPGRPIADPGAYEDLVVGRTLQLDGRASLSADHYAWSVAPTSGFHLDDPTSPTPSFRATVPGRYTLTLVVSNDSEIDSLGRVRPAQSSLPASTTIRVVASPFGRVTFDAAIRPSKANDRCLDCHVEPDVAGFEDFRIYSEMTKMTQLRRFASVAGNWTSRLLYKPAGQLADVGVEDGAHAGGRVLHETDAHFLRLKAWLEDGECANERCRRIVVTNQDSAVEIDPLSPFQDASLLVGLTGAAPKHGTLTLTPEDRLRYVPAAGYTGLDRYRYLVTDLASGQTGMITDTVYVFPDIGFVPANLGDRIASQYAGTIPALGSSFEFEKVNTDGDALPNYVDDFPNHPLLGRDNDHDGIPDAFNANVTAAQASASGIGIDSDDDNDGVSDATDQLPLDPSGSVFLDGDHDGVPDASDPFPLDLLGSSFEGFESGNLSARPWSTSGSASWSVVSTANVPLGISTPLTRRFAAQAPALGNDQQATLSVTLSVPAGDVAFWYFVSSEACCDTLSLLIDGVVHDLGQTTAWKRARFPVTAGVHTFAWVFTKDSTVTAGLDRAWIDAIEFSGPTDTDSDGVADFHDDCPNVANTTQHDAGSNGIGDACDAGDFDGDGVSDQTEVARGTSPSLADTDADGSSDGVDAFPSDPAASVDTDGDGRPNSLVPGVPSTSKPPLTADLLPFDPRGGLDADGDGVASSAIYTIAGTGTYGFAGDGGPARSAEVSYVLGIARDGSGNLYFADIGNNRVRRVLAGSGLITTYAGNGDYGSGGDGGPATAAQLGLIGGLATDVAGNLFIADPDNARVRRVSAVSGTIATVVGNGVAGSSGDGGLATAASIDRPSGLAFDSAGNLYVADAASHRIRKVAAATGVITTVAGTGVAGFGGDGGLAVNARISGPGALALDGSGNLYFTDEGNFRVRRVASGSGLITTVAGNGVLGYAGEGIPATEANLAPIGVGVDSAGHLYVADGRGVLYRVHATTGTITILAGTGDSSGEPDGRSGEGGSPLDADLNNLGHLLVDPAGNVVFGEWTAVRQVTSPAAADAFPDDPAATVDSDGDGYPDAYRVGATPAQLAATPLLVDAFPNDPTAAVDANHDGQSDVVILGNGLATPVPEPLSAVALAAATLALGSAARRRLRRADVRA